MVEIRLAQESDIPAYQKHVARHVAESGRDGDVIFTPSEEPSEVSEDVLIKGKTAKWSKPPTESGWERMWILVDGKEVVGDLNLTHHLPLKSTLHRVSLGIGIQRSHRGQGWGPRMIDQAIAWAREQVTLEWIDLYVFANNDRALKLYRKFGFREIARVPDLFRVNGQKIEDIHMVLNLKEPRR